MPPPLPAVEPGEALRAQEMLDLSSGQADRVRAGHDDHTIDDRVAIEDADGRGRGEGARLDRQSRREGHRERGRSEEHTSELQSQSNLVCRLLLEKKKSTINLHMNVENFTMTCIITNSRRS